MTGFNTVCDILRREEERERKNAGTTVFVFLVTFFLYPYIVMQGWNALAWQFNLPLFSYVQMIGITHGIRILIKGEL